MTTATVLLSGLLLSSLAELDLIPGKLGRRLGAYSVVWPQRWPFFTDLDQDVLVAYRATDGRFEQDRFGGLRRVGDVHQVEVRRAALRVPDGYWQACANVFVDGCPDTTLVYSLVNPAPQPEVCGLVAIAVERVPPPRPRELPRRQVYRIAMVDLRCRP